MNILINLFNVKMLKNIERFKIIYFKFINKSKNNNF